MKPELFILISTLLSYLISQTLKIIALQEKKKRNLKNFLIKRDGIVSSHSAAMIALIVSIFLVQGVTVLFIVSLIFSLIIISEIWNDKEKRLGRHSFREIILGTVVGELITLLMFIYFLL